MTARRHIIFCTLFALLVFSLEGTSQSEGFMFDECGMFVERVAVAEPAPCIIMSRGEGADPMVACLADPEHYPDEINQGTVAVYVSHDAIKEAIEVARVRMRDHYGFINGFFRLMLESGYGGNLDFSRNGQHEIEANVIYITDSWKEGFVAHNNLNFGNFLWGVAARELGVPLSVALIGSHLNNFFLSPDRGHFDSKDDQFSITAGYHWRY